ncbi:MAG: (d)CMP kinase, partial [Sulfolobales archaeon]
MPFLRICRKESLVIAVSGRPGSGKTTLAKSLADSLGLRYVSSGGIFRRMA